LLGLAIPPTGGGGPRLVWCGVFDGSAIECHFPTGQAAFNCSNAVKGRVNTITLIYRGGAGWPAAIMPLTSETMHAKLENDEWLLNYLPVGAYELRVGFAGEVRAVPFSVTSNASVVRLAWPY
jgi:hypothetical protein